MAGLENEIILMLGELREGMKRQETAIGHINKKLEVEEKRARESRSRIHERLDKQQSDISHLETTVVLSGQTVAQQRDVIVGLKKTIDEDISPTIEEVKDIKRLGKTASLIFVGLGFTAGGVFFTMWDTVRPWLGKLLLR
ncbi:hypothetical protein ABK249_02630 [Neorhizobium sp. Rsf11]|uniref:DUF1515 domain-containing protein n=2 Tax=Neorhizobium TaxID=1525371 RepID=A0ABV0LW53_9HYPH|nr:hypothetical protein [Neorhizobium petrolearium]MCC2608408.1 hypothetical protein [Neorhizobium petrolearium]WGI68686.1 hypothetical protein QEO92_00870 [Neorhizobium petrolearium]